MLDDNDLGDSDGDNVFRISINTETGGSILRIMLWFIILSLCSTIKGMTMGLGNGRRELIDNLLIMIAIISFMMAVQPFTLRRRRYQGIGALMYLPRR